MTSSTTASSQLVKGSLERPDIAMSAVEASNRSTRSVSVRRVDTTIPNETRAPFDDAGGAPGPAVSEDIVPRRVPVKPLHGRVDHNRLATGSTTSYHAHALLRNYLRATPGDRHARPDAQAIVAGTAARGPIRAFDALGLPAAPDRRVDALARANQAHRCRPHRHDRRRQRCAPESPFGEPRRRANDSTHRTAGNEATEATNQATKKRHITSPG